MFFEWGNEGKVWKSCTRYSIIRVITIRVMRSSLYLQTVTTYQPKVADSYAIPITPEAAVFLRTKYSMNIYLWQWNLPPKTRKLLESRYYRNWNTDQERIEDFLGRGQIIWNGTAYLKKGTYNVHIVAKTPLDQTKGIDQTKDQCLRTTNVETKTMVKWWRSSSWTTSRHCFVIVFVDTFVGQRLQDRLTATAIFFRKGYIVPPEKKPLPPLIRPCRLLMKTSINFTCTWVDQ